MWQTVIYLFVCAVIIGFGVRDKKRAYKLGYGEGYDVGYAQGKLDMARRICGTTVDDETFLRELKIKSE